MNQITYIETVWEVVIPAKAEQDAKEILDVVMKAGGYYEAEIREVAK